MTPSHGKPLLEKLEYRPGQRVYVEGAPKSFIGELDYAKVRMVSALPADWAHIFVANEAALTELLSHLELSQLAQGLWVSWPKKASGVLTNMTEQTLRDTILPLGWVDVKVCAIDDIWSGLKFVRRKSTTAGKKSHLHR
ncbi:MAG TPA: hypothetical protein VLF60_01890 [Candidatus Saccharimonadales bacterium]|nr:hypothetical protein [Candidatus Saccharimonadales bacterium]